MVTGSVPSTCILRVRILLTSKLFFSFIGQKDEEIYEKGAAFVLEGVLLLKWPIIAVSA